MKAKIIICSFASTDEIPGLQGKRRLYGTAADRVYAALKATVLEAGRFSVFEATASNRAAHLFTRLCQDPELETIQQGYPWTGVRRKTCDGSGVIGWNDDANENVECPGCGRCKTL